MRLLHYTDDPSVQDPNTDEVVVEAMFEDADGDYCWFRHRVRAVRPGSQVGVSRIEYAVLRHSDDPTHRRPTWWQRKLAEERRITHVRVGRAHMVSSSSLPKIGASHWLSRLRTGTI
jgi:hypothetical protein